MAAPREVCKICYNSTSHKATPTLTYEPKDESVEEETGPKICSVCRQEWAPIRVAKELSSSRWVRIRPRPKLQIHIDFMLCKNLKNRNECPRGQDCSYAHSKAELWAWNQERQKEPRPAPHINGSYQYQLCKYMTKSGNCPYGIKCTFAHNDEELQCWLKVQGPMDEAPPTYRCNVCQLRCNSKKQLEDHINSSRHRQQHHLGVGGPLGYLKNNFRPGGFRNSNGVHPHTSGDPRPRPSQSIPRAGFRLCIHVQNGKRCVYGDYCTFAHSQLELDQWNQQKQEQQQQQHTSAPSRSYDIKSDGSTTPNHQSFLPAQSPQGVSPLKENFSLIIRTSLSKELKQGSRETSRLEGPGADIDIQEVSGTPLASRTSNITPMNWIFEVSSKGHHTLHSVVMFDPLSLDFEISEVLKCSGGADKEKVPIQAKAKQGVGVAISVKMTPPIKLQVKVAMVPRSGRVGQLIIFHFGSFHLVRSVLVQGMSEQERRLMNAEAGKAKNPVKVDLYWENKYKKVAMDGWTHAAADKMPEYPLPKQIEDFIESGKYKNVDNRVTKENYVRRMHNLLYLEEFQQKLDLSRYDLYGVEITPKSEYSPNTMGYTYYAESGYHYVTVPMDELLFEGGQSVRQGCTALLLPSNQKEMYECLVEHVGRDDIVLKITEKAKQASATCRYQVSLRFLLDRVTMRHMHYAVDNLDLDTVFPVLTTHISNSASLEIEECLESLKSSELNARQRDAISSVFDDTCLKMPSLVLGPFGCGKTRALTECVKLLALHVSDCRVLVCTHTNSAAGIYVENLDAQWTSEVKGQGLPLFRIVYTEKRTSTFSPCVLKYCKVNGRKFAEPSLEELKTYKIIVSTSSTAHMLTQLGLPKGYFTHIFIDEAAQGLESEALIPLSLADTDTKLVLAGDHMQLDPPVYSPIARKYGLHVSLLERLFDMEVYNNGKGEMCKTILTENHRSHHLIMDLPSQLFYNNKLSCKAVFPSTGPVGLPAVKFVSVEGVEQQDGDSPSYYNVYETLAVQKQAQLLVDGGLAPEEVCVLAYYSKQVLNIRLSLRKIRLGKVQVENVHNVPGREFRALIISTVRTCSTELISEREAGFLTNPKLFNTAVTRARQWLIVVGEPVTLCTIGSNRLCWLEYIRRCIGLKSFEHPHPAQFEEHLDFKLVTRQILEKNYEDFFKTAHSKSSTPLSLSTSGVAMAIKQGAVISSRNEAGGEESDGAKTVGLSAETFASKVAYDTHHHVVKEYAVSPSKIPPQTTPPHPKITRSPDQASLAHRKITRSPDTSPAPPKNTRPPDHTTLSVGDELPPFIKGIMESVASHEHWCDKMLACSYPLGVASKMLDNLKHQKSVLENQRTLIQQQIHYYRSYVRLEATVSDRSGKRRQDSSPPLTFPSALPSTDSYSLSESISGLNSAFSYDNVANNFFSTGSTTKQPSSRASGGLELT